MRISQFAGMYRSYEDILRRIEGLPIWWHNGYPRYETFNPHLVGGIGDVALVQTHCQDCETRYDVATASGADGRTLRNLIAWCENLDIGDPPNACHALGARCSAGASMRSLQIQIIEYWEFIRVGKFARNRAMEIPLADADSIANVSVSRDGGAYRRIVEAALWGDWQNAILQGDYQAMVEILEEVGCSCPRELAHMVDMERQERHFRHQMAELRKNRLGDC